MKSSLIALAVSTCLVLVAFLALPGCDRRDQTPAPSEPAAKPAASAEELVVYCSADASYFRPVLDAFTSETGIQVRPLFDTEATKTFGLVQRLMSEKDAPQADVFVSSEALGMVRLDRAGLLEPYVSVPAEETFAKAGSWPAPLRSSRGTWYGFARRARVIVYNTRLVDAADVPRRLADLVDPKWKGRIGMARPQFGTTRSHLAALHSACSPDALEDWVKALKSNEVRLYDGNSSVVRAVSAGEIRVGLTDNDDVHAGLANGWPIAMILPSNQVQAMTHDRAPSVTTPGVVMLPYPENTLQIPHTVGIIHRCAHAQNARRFVDFVLSRKADDLLSTGEAHTYPTYHVLFQDPQAAMVAKTQPPELWMLDLSQEALADHAEASLELFERIVEKP